jgi:hypothetical protein
VIRYATRGRRLLIAFATTSDIVAPRRTALQAREGQTIEVTAVFSRNGTRTAKTRTYQTVLLLNIRDADTGELLTDHLWFNAGNIWKKAGLRSDDTVRFEARVIEYRTGYWGPSKLRRLEDPPRADYKLTPPRNLKVITSFPGHSTSMVPFQACSNNAHPLRCAGMAT